MKDPENQELLMLNGRFESWGKQISALNKRRNQIYNAPNMSGAKKRELLNLIEYQSGRIFDLIMDELEGSNLRVLQNTIFN